MAVTTQTAEQSLDICADWLVTDIAPGDVLLQRIGRLHRHQRTRPSGYEQAKVTVLAPSVEQLANTVDPITGAPCRGSLLGLGWVYENIVGVLAVRNWLTAKREINIPTDNRALVESSTHYAALREFAGQLGSVWQAHLLLGNGRPFRSFAVPARIVSIQWDDPLIDNQPVSDLSCRNAPRLERLPHRTAYALRWALRSPGDKCLIYPAGWSSRHRRTKNWRLFTPAQKRFDLASDRVNSATTGSGLCARVPCRGHNMVPYYLLAQWSKALSYGRSTKRKGTRPCSKLQHESYHKSPQKPVQRCGFYFSVLNSQLKSESKLWPVSAADWKCMASSGELTGINGCPPFNRSS